MAWFDIFRRPERIDEATKAFKGRGDDALSDKEWKIQSGEGIEDVAMLQMSGSQGIMGFNSFFNSYINKSYENEVMRILNYRSMAEYPEIGDVIEDACNEACKPDDNLNLINLNITDDRLKSNENIRRILQKEFEILFFERLDINDNLWDLFRSYMIDGRLFYERVVNPNKINSGIINIKKLPAETMDYEINPINGRITTYYQYLMPNMKRPLNRMEAEKLVSIQNAAKMPQLIIFNPEQVGFIHYGVHGRTLYEILGFLEKAKVPYNQLKLLETSVIIYRLVRSPERLVFKIDTGNMPRDKSIKYVERIKQKFVKKQTFNPMTGALSQEPEIFSLLENFYLPVGCLNLNTNIELVDGRSLPLSNIIDEFDEGKKNYVYTVDQKSGKVGCGEIEWA
ncbi:MAG: portal protein, partial [Bacteroidales bacterium]